MPTDMQTLQNENPTQLGKGVLPGAVKTNVYQDVKKN
jgi:hypothetical protein